MSHLLTFRRLAIETLLYSWDNVPADDKFDELCKLQRQAGGPNAGTPGTKNATKEFSILTEQRLLDKTINNNNDKNNNNSYGDDDNRKRYIDIKAFFYTVDMNQITRFFLTNMQFSDTYYRSSRYRGCKKKRSFKE